MSKRRKVVNLPARIEWEKLFMEITEKICERSLCLKYRTASIITDGTQIISIGYNGTFSHQQECCDYWKDHYEKNIKKDGKVDSLTFDQWLQTEEFKLLHREWSLENEVHAEINALNWISKRLVNANYTLYTYLSPCENCAKSIISYGIKKVYYRIPHKSLEVLIKNNITCIKI